MLPIIRRRKRAFWNGLNRGLLLYLCSAAIHCDTSTHAARNVPLETNGMPSMVPAAAEAIVLQPPSAQPSESPALVSATTSTAPEPNVAFVCGLSSPARIPSSLG